MLQGQARALESSQAKAQSLQQQLDGLQTECKRLRWQNECAEARFQDEKQALQEALKTQRKQLEAAHRREMQAMWTAAHPQDTGLGLGLKEGLKGEVSSSALLRHVPLHDHIHCSAYRDRGRYGESCTLPHLCNATVSATHGAGHTMPAAPVSVALMTGMEMTEIISETITQGPRPLPCRGWGA